MRHHRRRRGALKSSHLRENFANKLVFNKMVWQTTLWQSLKSTRERSRA